MSVKEIVAKHANNEKLFHDVRRQIFQNDVELDSIGLINIDIDDVDVKDISRAVLFEYLLMTKTLGQHFLNLTRNNEYFRDASKDMLFRDFKAVDKSYLDVISSVKPSEDIVTRIVLEYVIVLHMLGKKEEEGLDVDSDMHDPQDSLTYSSTKKNQRHEREFSLKRPAEVGGYSMGGLICKYCDTALTESDVVCPTCEDVVQPQDNKRAIVDKDGRITKYPQKDPQFSAPMSAVIKEGKDVKLGVQSSEGGWSCGYCNCVNDASLEECNSCQSKNGEKQNKNNAHRESQQHKDDRSRNNQLKMNGDVNTKKEFLGARTPLNEKITPKLLSLLATSSSSDYKEDFSDDRFVSKERDKNCIPQTKNSWQCSSCSFLNNDMNYQNCSACWQARQRAVEGDRARVDQGQRDERRRYHTNEREQTRRDVPPGSKSDLSIPTTLITVEGNDGLQPPQPQFSRQCPDQSRDAKTVFGGELSNHQQRGSELSGSSTSSVISRHSEAEKGPPLKVRKADEASKGAPCDRAIEGKDKERIGGRETRNSDEEAPPVHKKKEILSARTPISEKITPKIVSLPATSSSSDYKEDFSDDRFVSKERDKNCIPRTKNSWQCSFCSFLNNDMNCQNCSACWQARQRTVEGDNARVDQGRGDERRRYNTNEKEQKHRNVAPGSKSDLSLPTTLITVEGYDGLQPPQPQYSRQYSDQSRDAKAVPGGELSNLQPKGSELSASSTSSVISRPSENNVAPCPRAIEGKDKERKVNRGGRDARNTGEEAPPRVSRISLTVDVGSEYRLSHSSENSASQLINKGGNKSQSREDPSMTIEQNTKVSPLIINQIPSKEVNRQSSVPMKKKNSSRGKWICCFRGEEDDPKPKCRTCNKNPSKSKYNSQCKKCHESCKP